MKHLPGLSSKTFVDHEADLKECEVAKEVGDRLVVDFGHFRSHHKVIARKAGASPESAKNWLAGQHPPSLVFFLRLLPHSPGLQAMTRKLMGMEADLSPDFQRELNDLIRRHMK